MGLLDESISHTSIDSDEAIVARCQKGDRSAFDELVLRYQKKVFNVTYRMLGNYTEASDVAQEAFIRAYRSIKRFRGQSSFYTWLYTIASNLCRNRLRYLSRQRASVVSLDNPVRTEEGVVHREPVSATPAPAAVLDRKEKGEFIQEAINLLDEPHRIVVVLRDIELLPYGEISRILKVNIGTIKSRLHRARSLLREKLKDVI